MREIIELIYDIFSKWFQPKVPNETFTSRILRGFIGILFVGFSISLVILCIYLLEKNKNAA